MKENNRRIQKKIYFIEIIVNAKIANCMGSLITK
jgi:hypothetical protein